MVPLPLELYRTIISEVKRPQDLQTLATVSRTIQPEAERRIWHRYDGNFNLQGTIRFCHALSSAPRFAPYVHELNLYSYIRAPDDNLPSDEVIVEMLSGVFEQTTNLRSLAIGLSGPAPCSCATLFERSAFHLHTFSPQWLLFDDRMTAFLAKQMSIRSLHPGIDFVRSPLLDVVIPQGILPQLAAISGTDGFIAKNIRNRPVSYIGFDCGVPLSLLSGDALSMEPVKGVELYYGVAATESEALRSPHFANLELLCGLSVRTKEDVILYLSLLSKLQKLRSMAVYTFFNGERLASFIQQCREACPSLRTVQISLEDEDEYGEGTAHENLYWEWENNVGWKEFYMPVKPGRVTATSLWEDAMDKLVD